MTASSRIGAVRTGSNPRPPGKLQLVAPGYAQLQLIFFTPTEIFPPAVLRPHLNQAKPSQIKLNQGKSSLIKVIFFAQKPPVRCATTLRSRNPWPRRKPPPT